MYLIADLGLFDVKIADGPKTKLEALRDSIKALITSPLKIVNEREVRGIRPEWAGVPDGFTVVVGEGTEIPGIIY
ncbi:hypothetical protein KHC33_00250 [Methanospirillum sp. J.3.6.1-F.2.7.3]|uniref:Uncharacterized protein n=1 Tax=Methanospirillum purgamenti TaxID=2834276 RepID=A0A8E7EH75_9EURY|nr:MULTISPECIES: hypothetical protein [Methanospirillum]MDX8549625.1 hypothetical protein [Methanospirillum hungatei]QVV89008.1 hypothetical protein KHC33_00250 [Methanospirillum sp. J.3.6.1-F.2.7.3]